MPSDKFSNTGTEYMTTSKDNICRSCKYLISANQKKCLAFDRIPDLIWNQDIIHIEKYMGQKNDFVYQELIG